MSTFDHRHPHHQGSGGPVAHANAGGPTPGKHTRVEAIPDAPIQRARGGDAPAAASAPTAGGAALPPASRAQMEAAFRTDFSDVRVQEGSAAPAVGARAFARGSELHFAPGQYQPGTPAGDRLIGHELTHVVQQREGRVASAQAAPIQRQSNTQTPAPVYQYATGTAPDHYNDCGPASLLALLHMIDPSAESRLDHAIIAHRPTDQKKLNEYLALYGPATIPNNPKPSTKDYVCLQERLNVVRAIATSATPPTDLLASNKGTYLAPTTDVSVLKITEVRKGLIQLMHFIGIETNNAELPLGTEKTNKDKTDKDKTDTIGNIQPADLNQHWSNVKDYIKRHATGAQVVVALGVPEKKNDDGTYTANGWGFGGHAATATDPDTGYKPSGRDGIYDTNGHIVIIYRYNETDSSTGKADTFNIVDPSFDAPQTATSDQVKGFLGGIASKEASAVVNLLVVPLADLQSRVKVPPTLTPTPTATPTAQGAQASGAPPGAAGVVDDPALEAEADEMGARAAAGDPAHTS